MTTLFNNIQENQVVHSAAEADNLRNFEYQPQKLDVCFPVRDLRILSDRSLFEEYDARRKSYQFDKDFINDQDSVLGPLIIPNMIKNVMCTKKGSILHDPNFGVDLTYHLFENLNWVQVIEIRDHIAEQLNANLPSWFSIETIDVRANPDGLNNAIEVDIVYHYPSPYQSGPGPNLDTAKVQFTVGVAGFNPTSGFDKSQTSPNNTQFRRAI